MDGSITHTEALEREALECGVMLTKMYTSALVLGGKAISFLGKMVVKFAPAKYSLLTGLLTGMGCKSAEKLLAKFSKTEIGQLFDLLFKKGKLGEFIKNASNVVTENGIRSWLKEDKGTNVGDQVEGNTQGSGASNKGGSGNTTGTGSGNSWGGTNTGSSSITSNEPPYMSVDIVHTSGSDTHSDGTKVEWDGCWVYNMSSDNPSAAMPELTVTASMPVMLDEFFSECKAAGLDYAEAMAFKKSMQELYGEDAAILINNIAMDRIDIVGAKETYAGSNEFRIALVEKTEEQLKKEIQEKEQELKRSQREAEMRDLFNGDYDTYLKEIYGIESDDGLTFENMTGQSFPESTKITTVPSQNNNDLPPLIIDLDSQINPILDVTLANFEAQLGFYYNDNDIDSMTPDKKFDLFQDFCRESGIRIKPSNIGNIGLTSSSFKSKEYYANKLFTKVYGYSIKN